MCDWSELGREKLLVCADGKATTLDAQALCVPLLTLASHRHYRCRCPLRLLDTQAFGY